MVVSLMGSKPVIPIPPPTYFEESSGDRSDKAESKTRSLAAAIEHGGIHAAIAAGKINKDTLSRYLADGNYRENLQRIESALASRLAAVAYEKAEKGSEKMLEFVLPALDDRFDSGIRRQNVANAGNLASILLQKTLTAENVSQPGQVSDAEVIDITPTDSLSGTGILNDFAKLLGHTEDATALGNGDAGIEPISDDTSQPIHTLPPPEKIE